MDVAEPDLDRLEEKLNRLKREYDLFLAGQRRGEPTAFHAEVEREIVKLTRYPFHSTVGKFRMRTLAHRFRALESQIHNLVEQRQARKREESAVAEPAPVSVVVDRATLEHPEAVAAHLRSLHRALSQCSAERRPPPLDALQQRLFDEAGRILARPGVFGVRFVVVEDERGPRIRGEVIPQPRGG